MSTPTQTPSPVLFKLDFGGDKRRLRLSGPIVELEQLQNVACRLYGAALSHVTTRCKFAYVDEDGDIIQVASQAELDEAVRLCGTSGVVKMTVIPGDTEELYVLPSTVHPPPTIHVAVPVQPPPVPQRAVQQQVTPDVAPSLAALASTIKPHVLQTRGLQSTDAVDLVRVLFAMQANTRVLVKLGATDVPSLRAWKHSFGPASGRHTGVGGGDNYAPQRSHPTGDGKPRRDDDGDVGEGGGKSADDHGGSVRTGPPSRKRDAAARFVEHVTLDDESIPVAPGATVVKIWRVMNDGDTPWPQHVALVHVGGDAIPSVAATSKLSGLAPGAEAALHATLTAPSQPGTYRGVWRLQDVATGARFGTRLWNTMLVGAAQS